jgi:murein DD-endopeptidase MepM/ murein hydrolase activator NlpD
MGGPIGHGASLAGGLQAPESSVYVVAPGANAQAPGAHPDGASLMGGLPEARAAVAESATQTAPPPPPAGFTTHTVAEGETLTSIGEHYGVDVQYLVWNNPEVGTDPDMLAIGEDLIVPGVPGIIYDVRLGDTLIDIAATYGIEPSAIVSFAPNKLETPDLIVDGSVLVLPGGVPPAPALPEETPAPATPPEPVPAAPAPAPPRAPALPAIVRAAAPVAGAGLIWPVYGPVNSGFGPRWGSMHTGIDIGVGAGTPVAAAGSGQVVLATSGGGFGYYIIVRHSDGLETLYAHLSGIYVSLGQYVGQGEIIGASGCSGWCTGPHLHFEVHVGNTPVNPLAYLP